VAMTALSSPVYRFASTRALLWYSPLSVYLTVALYGSLAFAMRCLGRDFDPHQIAWAAGLQSILGMWWGITVLATVWIPVQLLAYPTRRVLRPFLGGRP